MSARLASQSTRSARASDRNGAAAGHEGPVSDREQQIVIVNGEHTMTNDTNHDRNGERKDMSIAAIKKRHEERQSAIKRLRDRIGPEQKAREVGTQHAEEEHRDD